MGASMEETTWEPILEYKLPIFGVECFGSAVVDPGRFPRQAGIAPAPQSLLYQKGVWKAQKEWFAGFLHELNDQPGVWVMALVDGSVRRLERDLGQFRPSSKPEVAGNQICDLYGGFAPPMISLTALEVLLRRRLEHILHTVHIQGRDAEKWVEIFRFPNRPTLAVREREAFLQLTGYVRTHPMNRTTRERVGAHVREYAYMGRVTPIGRPYTFDDLMKRTSQVEGVVKALVEHERAARLAVQERVKTFMNRVGLGVLERDVIRAFQSVSFWRWRSKELLALLDHKRSSAFGIISQRIKGGPPTDLLMQLRPSELTSLILEPEHSMKWDEVAARGKETEILFSSSEVVARAL